MGQTKLQFDPQYPLYTSDATGWRTDQLVQVLDRLYEQRKPIVFFVHGRGIEPQKSLRGAKFTQGLAVAKLELGYDVRVLMFNWDSAFRPPAFWDRSRPLSNIPQGAASLGSVLAALGLYRARHSATPAPVMLVHSMGSIVVQHCVASGRWPLGPSLFTQLVLTQPDADDRDHADWLDHLARRERVYVTLNRDDWVLKKSTDDRPEGVQALGLGTSQRLAAHARYIDLSNMGALGNADDDHEVFGKGAMNGQLHVCQFFQQALRGETVVLDPELNVDRREREVVYHLKSQHEPHSPCLQMLAPK